MLIFYTLYYQLDTPYHGITKVVFQDGDGKNTVLKTTKKKAAESYEKVHIFYNLFTKSSEDEDRVRTIVEEQFALVDPTIHEPNVTITSIGHRLPLVDASLGNASYHIGQHYEEGDEYLTLHALWKYCKTTQQQQHTNNKNAKVVYLHSKGSFHPNANNDRLRDFLTHGALSSQCANLPDTCNVCSSRMSPFCPIHTRLGTCGWQNVSTYPNYLIPKLYRRVRYPRQ